MDTRERAHRADPERPGPIRDWSTLYRDGAGPDRMHVDAAGRDTADNDTIARAVNLGYQVVEEHIRQGTDHADARNGGEIPGESAGNHEILRIVQRMLRCYMDLGALWMEVADTVLGNPQITESILKKMRTVTGDEGGDRDHHGVQVVIDAAKPLQVDVSLDSAHAGKNLAVHAPRELDETKPPLTEVDFVAALDGVPARLQVRVGADQPAGNYTGAIVERATNRSCGTLTVRVPD